MSSNLSSVEGFVNSLGSRPAPSAESRFSALLGWGHRPPPWTDLEKITYWCVSAAIAVLAYLYLFHLSRLIAFDEIGLHNPIYTYLTTGHMTYPLHGYPDYMVVHPPTHYAITAWLMKLGMTLFKAAAIQVFVLLFVTLALAYGSFSWFVALAAVLALFLATLVWGEIFAIRPDLIVTYCWFSGLIAFQSALNRGGSRWRLFAGGVLATFAATMHYWGVASLATPLVYGGILLTQWRRRPTTWPTSLMAIGCGVLIVGLPYLLLFVIPYHDAIRSMIAVVQGNGGPLDAYARQVAAYDAFAHRLTYELSGRWLLDILITPVKLGVPLLLFGVPLLFLRAELRLLSIAGALLPLFVMFFSQGKQVGYTGYFMPETVIYLFGVISAIFGLIRSLATRPPVPSNASRRVAALATALVGGVMLSSTPYTMADTPRWVDDIDVLDLMRAMGQSILGPDALVAVTSAGVWYTAGAHYVWNSFFELLGENRAHHDVRSFLEPADAVVIDQAWWNSAPDMAPVWDWYREGTLRMFGFMFPEPIIDRPLAQLFVSAKNAHLSPVTGFLFDRQTVRHFVEHDSGPYSVGIFFCTQAPPLLDKDTVIYQYGFAYNSSPSATSPMVVFLVAGNAGFDVATRRLAAQCMMRDHVVGDLEPMDRNALIDALHRHDSIIEFYMQRREVLAVTAHSDEGPPEQYRSVEIAKLTGPQFAAALGVNTYDGGKPQDILSFQDGRLVFKPATTRDHLALAYRDLPHSSEPSEEWLRVTLDCRKVADPRTLHISLQDERYVTLGDVWCSHRKTANDVSFVKLKGNPSRVRLVIQATTLAPTPLPSAASIDLMEP